MAGWKEDSVIDFKYASDISRSKYSLLLIFNSAAKKAESTPA